VDEQGLPVTPGDSPGTPGDSAGRREWKGTEGKGTEEGDGAPAAPAPRAKTPARAKGESPFIKNPPPAEDVQAYIDHLGASFTAEEFLDHYNLAGWVYGKNKTPIHDWKAAVCMGRRIRV
jgi:hypothetical protein